MTDTIAFETRALKFGMVGNCMLGAAGVIAAVLSNSQAILVDGLFSMVGFAAAAIALPITRRAGQGPDRVRPLGYAMDESIFATFRALVLFGLVLFSGVSAAVRIARYIGGNTPPELEFGPIGIYMVIVLAISGSMWLIHRRAWIRTGRSSDVLRLEATAVAFDAVMTVAAGLGFLIVFTLRDGPLGFVAPIGDSLIVLALCGLAAFSYFADFRRGLGELAGVTADPKLILAAGRTVRDVLAKWEGDVVDLSVLKSGRLLTVIAYLAPSRPVTGDDVDALTRDLNTALSRELGRAEAVIVISRHGRALPNAPQ